jgi:lysozyme family protein
MFVDAYNFMMDNEDYPRQYKTVPDAPPGAFAISGINSASFPTQFNTINAIPQAQRGPAIQNFYQTIFWNTWLDQLTSVELAKRVFDSAVNMSTHTSVTMLQTAINSIVPNAVTVDGGWGHETLTHANSIPATGPINIVDAFRGVRTQHYKDIVAKNPADQKYLNGWLARASK